jgi:ribosomal protein S18 acetylase RimI-like enzyme
MTLQEPLLSFWSAWRALGGARRATAWGEVVSDPRYTWVWESNHAAVLRDHDRVTAADIRAELWPDLRAAGARYEHVEFWDPSGRCPALDEIGAEAEHTGSDVAMAYEGPPEGPPQAPGGPGLEVRELERPEEDFWDVYRSSRNEFGSEMAGEVVDQLVARDRELLVPAGLRIFGGYVDGHLAGFATLISLVDVGYVDNVVTLPEYRRRGMATATTGRAARESLAGGDRSVHLLTEEGSRAQSLYERIGFRVRGRITSVTKPLPPA